MNGKNNVAFDIETTDIDKAKCHIIQFSAVKFDDDFNIIDTYSTYVKPIGNYSISIGAFLKHRITCEFLEDKPTFIDVALNIIRFFEDCDILTYNGTSFDIPILYRHFKDCGLDWDPTTINCYDACAEERRRNSNTLENTFKRYTGKTMEEADLTAHDALSDVKATIEVFKHQQNNTEYGPEEMLTIDNFISTKDFNGKMLPCFNYGKYAGVPVSYVAAKDKGYIAWIKMAENFNQQTKNYVEKLING